MTAAFPVRNARRRTVEACPSIVVTWREDARQLIVFETVDIPVVSAMMGIRVRHAMTRVRTHVTHGIHVPPNVLIYATRVIRKSATPMKILVILATVRGANSRAKNSVIHVMYAHPNRAVKAARTHALWTLDIPSSTPAIHFVGHLA